jgi:hypothetical protein
MFSEQIFDHLKVVMGKHSSLFSSTVSDEDKSFVTLTTASAMCQKILLVLVRLNK